MKFVLKIILIIVLLFGFSNYVNYLVTGKPPELNIDKPVLPDINISKIADSISEKFESVKDEMVTKSDVKDTYLYKWRDEKGIIHYASEKPTGNIQNLKSIKLGKNTNAAPTTSENVTSTEIANKRQARSTELPENIYSPEGIKYLFDQTKNVQNLMDEQFSKQEAIHQ